MKGSLVIAERELFGILRNRRTLWILFAISIVFSITVLLKWPSSSNVDLSSEKPKEVFRWLSYAMLASIVLVIPAFPATGLISEVKRRTMELLLNSPLMRVDIFIGKIIAVTAFASVLLSVTLPAMSCCYAMGGISLTDNILILYAVLIVACIELTILGLLVGTYARTPESGLRWAYGATFGIVIATVIPHIFLQGSDGVLASYAALLRKISPIPALQQIVGLSSPGGIGLKESTDFVTQYFLVTGVLCLVGAIAVVMRMNYSLMDRSRSQGVITDDRSRGQQVARRMFFLVDPQKRKSGIPWLLNPVMVKEFRSRQFGRLHWLLRLVAGCAILSLLLTLATTSGTIDWGVERIGGIIIVAQVSLILLMTPGISGAMIAGEIETGGWNLLRTTPLGPWRILGGKLVSVAITLSLLLCATLPGYGVMMVIKPVLSEQVFQVMISLAFTAVLCMSVSAAISSFFRSAATAVTVSYGVLILLLIGPMLIWMNQEAPFSHSFVESTLMMNPMAGALNAMQVEGFENYNLIPGTWSSTGILCLTLIIVLYFRTWRLCQPD